MVFTVTKGIHSGRRLRDPLARAHALTQTLTRRGRRAAAGRAGSRQVLHREEHERAGEQHPADHEVLVLESPLLDEPHHGVGQAQHVGDVKDLLLSPLGQTSRERKPTISSSCQAMGLNQQTVSWSRGKHVKGSMINQKQIHA